MRLLSTEAATNTTVSTSAITLTAAYGDGFHPRSANPKSPTVRDSATRPVRRRKARRDPPQPIRSAGEDQQGQDTKDDGLPKNPGPTMGMSR